MKAHTHPFKAPKVRNAFSIIEPVKLHFTEPSMTKQSFKDECDVNQILARFQRTGVVDHLAKHEARYGFADSVSYHEAQNLVAEAQSMFNELPAAARAEFDHDPAKFLDFVDNLDSEDKLKKLRDLGLTSELRYGKTPSQTVKETDNVESREEQPIDPT